MYIEKLKDVKQTVVTSYTYNHKLLIVTLSLVTVIAVQNFSHLLPSMPTNEVYAYNEGEKTVQCDYECLTRAYVILRTDEIHKEMRGEARIKALQEAHDKFNVIMLNK